MKSIRTTLLPLILAVAFCACKKEKKVLSEFNWVAAGNSFHYDYYNESGAKIGSKSFSIFYNHNYYYFMEDQNLDSLQKPSFSNIVGLYVKKRDGLYATAAAYDTGGIIRSYFSYLYAPVRPAVGQQIPVFSCKDSVKYKITIAAKGKTITVPKGTFSTYVMQYQNGDKGYWDPCHGLIMYEMYNHDNKTICTLKLNGITTRQ